MDGHRGHERGRETAAGRRYRRGCPPVVAHAHARRLVLGAVVALHVRPERRRLRLLTVVVVAESSVQYGFHVAGRRIVGQRHAIVAERVVRLEWRASGEFHEKDTKRFPGLSGVGGRPHKCIGRRTRTWPRDGILNEIENFKP